MNNEKSTGTMLDENGPIDKIDTVKNLIRFQANQILGIETSN